MRNCRILVTGLVQGIGFRPFVAELAESLGLRGQVKNLGGVVEIIIAGEIATVEEFIRRLSALSDTRELPGARIDSLQVEDEEVMKEAFAMEENLGFRIVQSDSTRELRRFLPVDLPTCDRCVAEMHDTGNRRYRYPFISCVACGPRFSIQKAVPYDRDTITMDRFLMCDTCYAEYIEKGNIRRHAQTIACRDCGPSLRYLNTDANIQEVKLQEITALSNQQHPSSKNYEAVLQAAISDLQQGKIIAVKDIGGFHFAFSAMDEEAAKRLREFKNRDKKPFAVMFSDVASVREYCEVSKTEEKLLLSSERPIVLLKKHKDFPTEICGSSDRIGALLPCNPLQILLLEATGPLVMTSGNRGGEPIITDEEKMMEYMGIGIDGMLTHDREILTPLDDSIYQVNAWQEERNGEVASREYIQLIRRARGLVPEPIAMTRSLATDTYAAGGDLKASFALGRDELVYMSQYFGDLEDVRCSESRSRGLERMEALLEIHPQLKVGDLHPSYVSSGGTSVKIQHHHAHVASVIAEHGLEGNVLGIACDGTGFGTDGSIRGSEFLLCNGKDMQQMGHFSKVKLLGGDAGARDADMTLFSYMQEAGVGFPAAGEQAEQEADILYEEKENTLWQQAWKLNINTAYSTSMGRLFDAAAALLDICHRNSYEGECAIALEQYAHNSRRKCDNILHVNLQKKDGRIVADSVQLLVDMQALRPKYSKEDMAYMFHHAIAEAIVEMAERICRENNTKQVALSGGTFINRILLSLVVQGLEAKDIQVYTNEKVPCGDGGIALGQMYLATFTEV